MTSRPESNKKGAYATIQQPIKLLVFTSQARIVCNNVHCSTTGCNAEKNASITYSAIELFEAIRLKRLSSKVPKDPSAALEQDLQLCNECVAEVIKLSQSWSEFYLCYDESAVNATKLMDKKVRDEDILKTRFPKVHALFEALQNELCDQTAPEEEEHRLSGSRKRRSDFQIQNEFDSMSRSSRDDKPCEKRKFFKNGIYNGSVDEDGQPNGIGRWHDSVYTYDGSWRRGVRSGKGTLMCKDRLIYSGCWENDKQNGHGTFFYADSSKYEKFVGQWSMGKKHGHGTLFYRNGMVLSSHFASDDIVSHFVTRFYCRDVDEREDTSRDYVKYLKIVDHVSVEIPAEKEGRNEEEQRSMVKYIGSWNEEMQEAHGEGKMYYSDGASYSGSFLHHRRHGSGKMKYANGDVYDGQFKADKRDGFGLLVNLEEDKVQRGFWKKDEYKQVEVIKMPDGSFFSGSFLDNGHRETGMWVDLSKNVYFEGQFLNDRYLKGILKTCEGEYNGEFNKHGQKEGRGKLRTSQGTYYEGYFSKDMYHGPGKLKSYEGVYNGNFWEGKKDEDSEGEFVYATGDVYKGYFKENKCHGDGKMTYLNGDWYEGHWENGFRHGHGEFFDASKNSKDTCVWHEGARCESDGNDFSSY